MRKIPIIAGVFSLLITSCTFAASLQDDMNILIANLGIVSSSTDTKVITSSLEKMRNAALDAQKAIPPKLEGKAEDSPEIKDYRHGFDLLIEQIDKTKKWAEEGNIQEVKKSVGEVINIRNTYHSRYR